jgi:hypothetical protein
MPQQNDEGLLARLVKDLSGVRGVRAIALGGSRARGTASASSDYDIGLYYDPDDPIDVGALQRAVATMDDAGLAASVTPLGAWGQWIDGGGWLTIAGTRVDLIYRDLRRVEAVIADCRAGRIERHYQPGHPHAFVSAIYMGEVAYGRVLWDPAGTLVALKQQTVPYPPPLAAALLDTFLWEAGFALANARHGRGLDDVAYVAGCGFRCVACLCQALFAMNRIYLLNEKGAVAATSELARRPDAFDTRVAAALQAIGRGRAAEGIDELDRLVHETEALR